MTLRQLDLKHAYSSDVDDVLGDFYVPALSVSTRYDRIAGFFSSSSLAIAARGISGLVQNGGQMRLLASPRLTRKDVDALVDAGTNSDEYLAMNLLGELDMLEEQLIADHVRALAWMVANEVLQIKVCLLSDSDGKPLTEEDIAKRGFFHQKVGVLEDAEGNLLTFSGSANETASAWHDNIEELKVFRGWEHVEQEYLQADMDKFARLWEGRSPRVRVMDVPDAVARRFVSIAPADFARLRLQSRSKAHEERSGIELYEHQREAVRAWVANDHRGIFAMATGTGKTYTALGCLRHLYRSASLPLVVIACPYNHLVSQWCKEIDRFGLDCERLIVADATNSGWAQQVAAELVDIALGYSDRLVVVTTHTTLASERFRSIVSDKGPAEGSFLIADEVHGVGATKMKRGLSASYEYRLGLSATPVRHFDVVGTEAIDNYFSGTVYEFPLSKAVTEINPETGLTYLVPYKYHPHFVHLTEDEVEEYIAKTKAIATQYAQATTDAEKAEQLQLLLFRRADITKSATEKYAALEELLRHIGTDLNWTLVYCSPSQIDNVMGILNSHGLRAHRFTMAEGTEPEAAYAGLSERDFILEQFQEQTYQALVAMRCLDEGVDVPPARRAILMASSQNPRQYIQRLGRVLRRSPGKNEAEIHDVIVTPRPSGLTGPWQQAERRIFENEVKRCEEIAHSALNTVEALSEVYSIREEG